MTMGMQIQRGLYRGSLWHGSWAKKITNHRSWISKFHFPESRKYKQVPVTLLICPALMQRKVAKKESSVV